MKMNTKINFKNWAQKSGLIVLGIVVAVGASYVQAMNRPADISTNAPEVLNVSNTTQVKDGLISVLSFMAGDYATTSTSNYMLIDNLGIMAIGKQDTPGASKGISLDIEGTTGILGTIRSEDLKSSGLKEVCADPDGKIVFCTKEKEYTSINKYEPSYYGLMVPDGVTSMTVEIYGAGGSGFAKNNPETGADNGQSSYLIGDGVSIIAEGGQAADLPTVGGKSGKVSVSGADIVSKYEEGDGSAPGSFNKAPSQVGSSSTCSGTSYSTIKGAKGNVGGKGGKPYNGSNANGGSAGNGAPTSGTYVDKGSGRSLPWNFNIVDTETNPPINRTDCDDTDRTSDEFVPGQDKNNRPGGNGADGASYGAGGAGFGGKGGLSAVYSGNINNCTECEGGQSSAGGGAGAYVKATIKAPPNETLTGRAYYLKVGNAGKYQSYGCTSGGGGSNNCLNDLGGGATPGAGANGYIKVTYNN